MKLANIHCHFMHSNHLPDSYMRFSEKFAVVIRNFMDVDKFWYKNGTIDNYIKTGQYACTINKKDTITIEPQGMQGYHIIVPLMMNMVAACNTFEVGTDSYEYKDPFCNKQPQSTGSVPFITQVYEYSLMAALYPYRVFPFIVFNPLIQVTESGKNHLAVCQSAIKELGFVGIKMYPAHGYSPDPCDYIYDPTQKNDILSKGLEHPDNYNKFQPVGQALIDLYKWVDAHGIPVTTHCQYDAMQKVVNVNSESLARKCHPAKWKNVLGSFKNMRINFAHFGGNKYVHECSNNHEITCVMGKGQCKEFTTFDSNSPCKKMPRSGTKTDSHSYALKSMKQILDLAKDPKYNSYNRIFTDISAHYINKPIISFQGNQHQKRYATHIKGIIDDQRTLDRQNLRVMYGTDTPVPNIFTTSDREFLEGYSNVLHLDDYQDFYWYNAIDFVFGQTRTLPDSYLHFLETAEKRYSLTIDRSHLKYISNDGITLS
jgi:predicted TIM-barrel fold metal-dependent hydrolase